ncbi:polyprenyl synthetase family protein [Streptomyces sp. NPDC051211]|uniref:polyprenyl synthetase family protein n=1 Tax=Streptomyces sp. NPDC051211 TaxID=3154643 RepID=UPI0034509EF4
MQTPPWPPQPGGPPSTRGGSTPASRRTSTRWRTAWTCPALGRFAPRALELLRDLSLRGGKRLRPALVYEAARLVTDEDVPGLDEAALSLELLQTHGLVHDDIIDDSPVRRGGPSTYYAYRQDFPDEERTASAPAILAGDLAGFLSVRVLLDGAASAEVKQAMLTVQLDTGAQTVAGQIIDLERDSHPVPDEELLHAVTEFKSTRHSILAPLRLGLLAAGADLSLDDERLRRYATALGIAGQMRNDYLDLFEEQGAGAGSDIRAGRRTYAVRAVLAAADSAVRAVVEDALGDADCTRSPSNASATSPGGSASTPGCARTWPVTRGPPRPRPPPGHPTGARKPSPSSPICRRWSRTRCDGPGAAPLRRGDARPVIHLVGPSGSRLLLHPSAAGGRARGVMDRARPPCGEAMLGR